nr:hypothetical protein [Tanacetum cinerariifolium]
IPTTIPDTTSVITSPTTQTDTTLILTETPIIAPTIPSSPDYTPASLDYSPTSDTESDPSEDPSSGHIPPLPAPIPHGRSYRYHPNGPVHMMTARKRETRVERVTHPAMPEDIPKPTQEGAV